MNHLLSATILLFAVWPAYYLLLRYSSKYSLNRLLLLLAMVAVGTLPFIDFSSPAPVVTQSIQGTISYLEEGVLTGGASIDPVPKEIRFDEEGEEIYIANRTATTIFFLPKMYYFGLGLLTLVLGFRLLFILGLHLRSRLNGDGSYRLLHPSAKPGQAFTFGRNLYFSVDVPDDTDFNHILTHERVHARQLHSLDILLSEAFLCIFWFHPAAWWLRAKMRANLEFLVDKAVISNGADRRDYQLALVRQSQGAYGLALALPFSEPTLKSRIFRMTGMPEYRMVALIATVALVFWLGVSLLVVNGTIFEDNVPQGREYLEAAAQTGDPYYEHYQNTLPEKLTSLEIYTNRMVTVDEYLQLRAILGKAPGAKLYVYKNAFDEGYSLELRYGNHEHAIASGLTPEPSKQEISILHLMPTGNLGLYLPLSMTWRGSEAGPVGELNGLYIDHGNKLRTDLIVREDLLRAGIGDELLVFVNREKIDLVENANVRISTGSKLKKTDVSVKVNGMEVSTLGATSWPEILVEGRPQLSPQQRIEKLLEIEPPFQGKGGVSFSRAKACDGTYRSWYEDLGYLKDQPILTYYNDRPVSLDFLLDTEFGDNVMIQHGVVYDTHLGRYALQVLDDYPDVTVFFGGPRAARGGQEQQADASQEQGISVNDLSKLYDGKDVRLDLFFKRLPMPSEVDQLNGYLEALVQKKISVFQDCSIPEGDYTLQLGTGGTSFFGFESWPAGSRQENPVRLQMRKDGSGGFGSATFRPAPLPDDAPNADVLLRINGAWLSVYSAGAVPYTSATLDPGPLKVKLRCLLGLNPDNIDEYNIWTVTKASFREASLGDEVQSLLQSQKLGGLPIRYFIGEREVAADVFASQPMDGAILSMASRTEGPDDRVVARVD
ncbi:MAG: M56 family metallopeptidase [Lewinella sp.]